MTKNSLYTLKEVAELLRVSERTVLRYIDSKRLKATKIGQWRIASDDLQDFMEQGTNK